MVGARVEPVGNPGRQRLGRNGERRKLIGGRVCGQRVLQLGEHDSGRPHLVEIGGVEEVAHDLALQAHRDTIDFDLKTAVSRGNRRRNRQPPAVKPTRETRRRNQSRKTLGHYRPLREQPARLRTDPSQRVAPAHDDPLAGVDANAPVLVQHRCNPAAGRLFIAEAEPPVERMARGRTPPTTSPTPAPAIRPCGVSHHRTSGFRSPGDVRRALEEPFMQRGGDRSGNQGWWSCSTNQLATWLRAVKPSFRKVFSTWLSAVRGEMTSLAAICRLGKP
jgi:hypothetical protein